MTRASLAVLFTLALCPSSPAQTTPLSPSQPSIDQLIDQLNGLRGKRSELERQGKDLERQERDVASSLREKLREQIERLQKLGVTLDAQPPPNPNPVPVPQPVPVPVDPLLAAYQADKAAGLGGAADLKLLAGELRTSGEALDRVQVVGEGGKLRQVTVGDFRKGLEIIVAARLPNKLPGTFAAVKAAVKASFPDDATAMTPANGVACKLVLLSLAARLEKLTVL